MPNDALDALLEQASKAKLLSLEEERQAITEIERGSAASRQSAKDRIACAFMPLVVGIAKRIHQSHEGRVDLADLIGAGQEGLLHALQGFDPKRGTRFSTYARWWIRNFVYLEVRASRWGSIPDGTYRKLIKIMRAMSCLTQTIGRTPRDTELADFMKWPLGEVQVMLAWFERTTISLDTRVGDGNGSLSDFIADRRTPRPEQTAEHIALEEQVRKLLATLQPREEQMLRLYFGIGEMRDWTFRDIGQRYALSSERARQIVYKALRKLRSPSRARFVESFARPESEDCTPRLLFRLQDRTWETEAA